MSSEVGFRAEETLSASLQREPVHRNLAEIPGSKNLRLDYEIQGDSVKSIVFRQPAV